LLLVGLLLVALVNAFKRYVRPDIFYFSSFKNPDRIFSRNGKTILIFFIVDRMKIVPNL